MIFEAEVTANLPLFRIIMTSERAFYRDFCTQEMKFDTFVMLLLLLLVWFFEICEMRNAKCSRQSQSQLRKQPKLCNNKQ